MNQIKLGVSISLSMLAIIFYRRVPILKDNLNWGIRIPLTLMIATIPNIVINNRNTDSFDK